MRNSKTHSITIKRKLPKCSTYFYAFSELQHKYGKQLSEDENVLEFKANVKLEGFEIFMVDMTRWPKSIEEDVEDNRGKQIRDYLLDNKVDRFVILDDMDDGISNLFPNEFIRINRFYRLNEDVAKKIKEKLRD